MQLHLLKFKHIELVGRKNVKTAVAFGRDVRDRKECERGFWAVGNILFPDLSSSSVPTNEESSLSCTLMMWALFLCMLYFSTKFML